MELKRNLSEQELYYKQRKSEGKDSDGTKDHLSAYRYAVSNYDKLKKINKLITYINMKQTKLMTKIFSSETKEEFLDLVSQKIDEAREKGTAEIVDGDNNLQFAEVDGKVIIEDQGNENEVTAVIDPETEGGETSLEAVEVPEEETKTESKKKTRKFGTNEYPNSEPDAIVKTQEGTDGDHVTNTAPDIQVTIDEGVTDDEKAGMKIYSISTKGFCGDDKISKMAALLKALLNDLEGDKEVIAEVSPEIATTSFAEEPETEPESSPSDEAVDALVEKANGLTEKVKELEETSDKETASEIKAMAEEILAEANKLEAEGHDTETLKSMCDATMTYASQVLDAEDPEGATSIAGSPESDEPKPTPIAQLLNPLGSATEEESVGLGIEPKVNPNDDLNAEKIFSASIPKYEESGNQLSKFLTVEF